MSLELTESWKVCSFCPAQSRAERWNFLRIIGNVSSVPDSSADRADTKQIFAQLKPGQQATTAYSVIIFSNNKANKSGSKKVKYSDKTLKDHNMYIDSY